MKDGNNQTVLNRADINKIFGSASGQNGVIGNKVALYSSEGSLFAKTFAIKNENDDDFVILRCRNSSGWRSLYIPSLDSNADIIIDQTNQTIYGDKTFSQAITMIQEGSANNHLVTKKYVDDEIAKIPSGSGASNFLKKDGSVAMTGDLNMNEQRVKNTLDPTDEQDTVNKRYLESQLTDYLKRNGQNTMTFDLNMNSYKIVNLKDITSSSNDSEAVNKKYVDDETSNFLKLDGSVSLSGDLNMATNKIKNLGTPLAHEDDAAVKDSLSTTMQRARVLLFLSFVRALSKVSEAREPDLVSHAEETSFLSVEDQPPPRVNRYGSVVSLVFGSEIFSYFHLSSPRSSLKRLQSQKIYMWSMLKNSRTGPTANVSPLARPNKRAVAVVAVPAERLIYPAFQRNANVELHGNPVRIR